MKYFTIPHGKVAHIHDALANYPEIWHRSVCRMVGVVAKSRLTDSPDLPICKHCLHIVEKRWKLIDEGKGVWYWDGLYD